MRWEPFGEAAFDRARRENKPVLLSVGYSSCHWCHVMAHESFENPATAELMNALFVNIKVDREERPDVDLFYQQALSLMGKQGGWPLTMFLDADKKPFWGGTYFPPEPRHGMPSFAQVLEGVAKSYTEEKDAITHNVKNLEAALQKAQKPEKGSPVTPDILDKIADHFFTLIDPANGGLGGAPKFPQLSVMGLLWDAYARTDKDKFKAGVVASLSAMCQGGLYDHAGGGFHRYTVDEAWLVPHFEKMLYDNALFISLLADVFRETGNPLFKARLQQTVSFVLDEMRVGDSFVTSYDADSEGEEGLYYVWTEAEVDKILSTESAFFKQRYDVTKFGNWEGVNILNRLQSSEWLGDGEETRLAACLEKLKAARQSRVKPFRDDKIQADLNGLMIAALAKAAFVLQDKDLQNAALKAFDALATEHLPHTGKTPGFIEDYAFMIEAALALFETTTDMKFFNHAKNWADIALADFQDNADGGFFMSGEKTDMTLRLKSAHDNPAPSGNSVMIANLHRIFLLTGDKKYAAAAEKSAAAFSGTVREHFFPYATLLRSTSFLFNAVTIVITGKNADMFDLTLRAVYVPNLVIVKNPPQSLFVASGKQIEAGKTTAFVCAGTTCQPPVYDTNSLKTQLLAQRRHIFSANDG